MIDPLKAIAGLVTASRRRAMVSFGATILPALMLVVVLVAIYGTRGFIPGALVVMGLSLWSWSRVTAVRLSDEQHAARRLDDHFDQLQDSSALLLAPRTQHNAVEQLQYDVVSGAFAPLADGNAIDRALPEMPYPTIVLAWVVSTVFGALLLWALAPKPASAPANIQMTALESVLENARVSIEPPDYLELPTRTRDNLNVSTVAEATLVWSLQLAAQPTNVALRFHDDASLELTRRASSWESDAWPARSTVYTIEIDGITVPNAVFKIDALPDQAPTLAVSAPTQSLRLLNDNEAAPKLQLAFEARDDHQVVAANARVTLARGSGEQVRFREQSIAMPADISDDGQSLSAQIELDLLELGMERGDELYLFAEVTDNKPDPNIGASGTYIVRWPDEEATPNEPVVTMAMDVLPEYFRSQRQIIIDSEALIAERDTLDRATFTQRAQTLAIDQKLLRLRYGQYLGEEADSGIGAAALNIIEADVATENETDNETEHHDEHDGHDHAGHDDPQSAVSSMTFGDRQAAMDLYTHFHDRAEQATLFEPKTRDLLQRALAQMWDAELHLRLYEPDKALPYEYAALDFIKRVQQSSRIYLRRTGFRPTPIDEERRLTGELDDILTTKVDSETGEGELTTLRRLYETMNSGEASARSVRSLIDTAIEGVRERSRADPTWLELLAQLQRAQSDACGDCYASLSAAIWQQLAPARAAPAPTTTTTHPLTQAYEQRLINGGSR
ncbi:MAG: hypothetical protein AB8G16_13410 [Gammaproteobacteria bacterium]